MCRGPLGRVFTDEDFNALSEELQATMTTFFALFETEVVSVESQQASPSGALQQAFLHVTQAGLGDTCCVTGAVRRLGLVIGKDGEVTVVPSQSLTPIYGSSDEGFLGQQW